MNAFDEKAVEEGKKLTYVRVYEKLYTMITDGSTFPVGTRLPAEPKLAAMLGVSRMTLRQALELLHEDGLLAKMQGKGNFVIDDVEMEFRIEPPNEHEQEMFKKRTAVSVAVDRWYRGKGKLVAYTLSLMPIETISKLKIDLNYNHQLLNMLEKGIYGFATRSHLVIQPTTVGNFISEKYVISENGNVTLIWENIYGEDDYAPLVCNKHYMLPQCSSIEVNTTK